MSTFLPFGVLLSLELVLMGLSVGLAALHAHLIKKNEPIQHWVWATLYTAIVGFTLIFWRLPWIFGFIQLCGHLAAFDWSLDAFRRLPWNYRSATTTSAIDQFFGPYIFWAELFCAIAYLSAQYYIL